MSDPPSCLLTVADHNRAVSGMKYVYPVVSRRAGGVSVGINLNPNQACNWRCVYCQVPNLKRGGPPPVDLVQLGDELRGLLYALYVGDYLERCVPVEARRVVDIAFSGDGEPTSATEFSSAVNLVARLCDELGLSSPPRLRLITNGSLIDRANVRHGISALGARRGEVWFKVDAVMPDAQRRINSVAYQPSSVARRLRACGRLCETWVQTCVFALDDIISWHGDAAAYLELLREASPNIAGVYLYGLARESMQPEALRLRAVSKDCIEGVAHRIQHETGLTVRVSP